MERSETKVRFFIEEHPENLKGEPRYQVLSRILSPETCAFLESRGWGIALATIEPDQPTAMLIKRINQGFPKLPISAWIVVDDKNGYWTNKFNVPQTRQKVEEVKAWANHFDLNLEAMGFDLETPIWTSKAILYFGFPAGLLREAPKTRRQYHQQKQYGYSPEDDMQDILNQLKKENIGTHSYELPFPLNLPSLGVLQNKGFDIRATMVYSTQGIPRVIENRIPTVALKKDTYPAIGVYSSTGRVPGRSFGLFDKSGINPQALDQDIQTLAKKRRFKKNGFPNQLWVFALDGIEVARWTEEALQKARSYR